jgi:hypothetical protein
VAESPVSLPPIIYPGLVEAIARFVIPLIASRCPPLPGSEDAEFGSSLDREEGFGSDPMRIEMQETTRLQGPGALIRGSVYTLPRELGEHLVAQGIAEDLQVRQWREKQARLQPNVIAHAPYWAIWQSRSSDAVFISTGFFQHAVDQTQMRIRTPFQEHFEIRRLLDDITHEVLIGWTSVGTSSYNDWASRAKPCPRQRCKLHKVGPREFADGYWRWADDHGGDTPTLEECGDLFGKVTGRTFQRHVNEDLRLTWPRPAPP